MKHLISIIIMDRVSRFTQLGTSHESYNGPGILPYFLNREDDDDKNNGGSTTGVFSINVRVVDRIRTWEVGVRTIPLYSLAT